MSTPAADGEDWRAGLDDVDAAIVDGYQSGFPVTDRPFAAVGDDVGVAEAEALRRLEALLEAGVVRRFGAVLNPPVVGASTLAALQAPEERFDEIAEIVNDHRQVNHNYRRDHEWNMWFVVTAGSLETRNEILADVAFRTGCEVLNLPMLTDFYIDLEFPVVNTDRFARETRPLSEGATGTSSGPEPGADAATEPTAVSATRISETAAADLSDLERALVLEMQDGFPLSSTPYADLAAAVDAPTGDVLAAIERLRDDGCIKRIGCVVDHVATGFDANCMVVWDVPDDELDDRGETVGALPFVTLCYHRPRRPEQGWPYNLFTMIHGRDRAAVDEQIDAIAADHLPFEHERLYSTRTLKQTGARYDEIVREEKPAARRRAATENDGGSER